MHSSPRSISLPPKSPWVLPLLAGWLVLGGSAPAAGLGETEPVVTTQVPEAGSDIAWGRAEVVLERRLSEVLPIVVDYGHYVEFMPNFTRSKILAQRGGRAMVYMEVSVGGALTLWGQLQLAERPDDGSDHVVEASLLEGNMTAFRASWILTPDGDGSRTRVRFSLFVDPDLPLPSGLISRENERAAGKTLGALRERLAIVEAGTRP